LDEAGAPKVRLVFCSKRIVFCGRCWGEHESVEFRTFARPSPVAGELVTHWALCPTNGEPLFLSDLREGGENPFVEPLEQTENKSSKKS
jgi:hypothetical protein